MIAMLAAFSCACDDDSKDDSCVNGTRICNGSGVRAECVDGDFVEIPCSAGSTCDNGACKQVTENCANAMLAVPGIDGHSISYCVNGRMVTDPCPDGYTVMNGLHGAYCMAPANSVVADSSLCTSNGAQRCSAMGVHQVCNGTKWVDQPCTTNADEASAWKCESGKCVHYTVCYEGLLSCDGNTVLQCTKGAKENLWKKSTDCAADGKVCRAGKCVDGGGSSQGGKITCDEYESQYGECQMKSGGSCADYCRSQGSDKCYVDLDEGVIDCGEGGSSSGDYMTCDEVDEQFASQGGCVLDSGEKCQDACKDEGSDVCYISMADGALLCEDPGGSSSSGEKCDLYDCGSTKFENNQTGTQICADEGQFSSPVCDAEGLYCMKREASKDSTCSDGETAYTYQKTDGTTGSGCFVVGTSSSCLTASGTPSGGGDDTIYDCSDEMYQGKTLSEGFCDAAKPVAICVPCNEEKLWCVDQATASKVIGQSGSAVGLETGCEGGSSSGGDSCDEKTYKESCNGNTGLYCYQGKETTFSCDASAPCAISASSGIADCATTCKAGDADSVYCYKEGSSYYAIPMHCEKTTSGSYGYFLDSVQYTPCSAGCTNGVGCK